MKQRAILYVILSIFLFSANSVIAIPNPAAVYCGEQGYEYVIRSDQVGVCISPDGIECDAWQYYCKCNPEECQLGNYSCDLSCKKLSCKKAGESALVSECCEGLNKIPPTMIYDDECNETGMGGWTSICSDCGNYICDSWENKCNCPEDCGGTTTTTIPRTTTTTVSKTTTTATTTTITPLKTPETSYTTILYGIIIVGLLIVASIYFTKKIRS